MSLSCKKLRTLRSGQTVYRVLGFMRKNGEIDWTITPTAVVGKKVLVSLGYNYQSIKMVWKKYQKLTGYSRPTWMYGVAVFLNDLHGTACFDTMHKAQRWLQEVKDGLHPDVVERIASNFELNKMFDSYDRDDDSYEYKDRTQYEPA